MDGQFIKYAVLMLALVDLSKCYPIIKTEHELINTCTRNCYQIHTVFDKFGCDRVDHCGLASTGWTRGFHRCDYCQCECITDNPRIEHVEDMIKNYYTFRATEPQLYGTCTNTCDKGGLVRTNYGRCDEVRDCRTQSRGWTRGFVRCDYCVCDCVEYAYAATYTMKNFEFSLGDIDTNKNTPSDVYLGEVIVHNSESSEQVVSKTITTTLRSTSSWAMGESLSWGVSVNMEVGIGIDGFSLSRGIEVGTGGTFTYEVGSEISQVHIFIVSHNILGSSVNQ